MKLSQHDFLIRKPGFVKARKLPRFDELPLSDKLLLDLLSNRIEMLEPRIAKFDDADWREFVQVVGANGFANLILEKLVETGHQKLLAVSHPETLKELQRISTNESMQSNTFDQCFLKLTKWLSPFGSSVIWCKGASLRLYVYSSREYRYCSDFDIVVSVAEALPVITKLISKGFQPIKGYAGFCNQLGVGPVNNIDCLLQTPAPDLVPKAPIGLSHEQFPGVDIKFSPLDRGLKLIEEGRFWADSSLRTFGENVFREPATVDHLMICAENYVKDGFKSWKSLFDVHLLSTGMSDGDFVELMRRCSVEGISTDLWAALNQSREMFGTKVPERVFDGLQPTSRLMLRKMLHFNVNGDFTWNSSSLFGLALNTLAADDVRRKFQIIGKCVFPNREFLRAYYGKTSWLAGQIWLLWLLHIWVLLLPGIAIRKTIGPLLWDASTQYSELEGKPEAELPAT